MKTTNNNKRFLFTNAIRKELCGDSYWVATKVIDIHLSEEFGYSEDRKYELKTVIEKLVEAAYHKGYAKGGNDLRRDLKALLHPRSP
jgi:hypothetical protein